MAAQDRLGGSRGTQHGSGSSSHIRIGLGFLAGGEGYHKQDGGSDIDYEIIRRCPSASKRCYECSEQHCYHGHKT